ncbi:MAG TPA: hypothetical protein VMU43_09530 [Candidatus Acidoferrum sp.]|nr:hypothetical protein [Candidatus Acidoferrum sp.]
MAYQIFEKVRIRNTTPALSITPIGRIMLNSASARIFHTNAVEYVLLLLDQDQGKVALRPITKKDQRAYKVTYGKNNNGCSFSGKSFLDFAKIDYSKTRSFPAVWNENESLLEVTLPAESFKDETRKGPVSLEQGRRQGKVSARSA